MSDPPQQPVEQVTRSVEAGAYDDAAASLRQVEAAPVDVRKAAVRAVRRLANERPAGVGELLPSVASFLTDDDRAVRLTTSKLFVAVAREAPSAVVPCIDDLADRLADEAEFYYVRARTAEALGYVALDHPREVASPALLADLRVGLSFDETAVREKLAKALAYVALGNPERLRHQVGDVATHLDDGNELVRYHLCTTLAVIGCRFPGALSDAEAELAARLDDESPYVRGRAAEAVGLLARSTSVGFSTDDLPDSEAEAFAAERAQFARAALAGDDTTLEDIGRLEGIRESIDDGARAISAFSDGTDCPQCGLSLPADGPPACPRCGTPC